MSDTTEKTEIKVRMDIRPGPVSPAQKTAWRKFFSVLIAECKQELQAESEGNSDRAIKEPF